MRERAYEVCRDWCVSRGLRGEVLDTWPVSDVDPLLRDYGQHLFRGGAAVGEAVDEAGSGPGLAGSRDWARRRV